MVSEKNPTNQPLMYVLTNFSAYPLFSLFKHSKIRVTLIIIYHRWMTVVGYDKFFSKTDMQGKGKQGYAKLFLCNSVSPKQKAWPSLNQI